ncbi:MAG: histidine kinase [Anaerolineales bacterium]|nr:histidine kinase [Anaerolineales bacterium]
MALLTALLVGTCAAGSSDVLKTLVMTYPALQWPIALLFFVPHAGLLPWTAVFPDGRFVPSWSKWLVLPSVAISLLVFFPANEMGQIILTVWWPVVIMATLGLLYYRYRRYADIVQQQQLRWPTYGTAITVFVQVSVFMLELLFPAVSRPGTLIHLLADTVVVLSITLLVLCFGLAILRYRLLAIAFIINRTLVYGTLTAIIAGVYGLVIGLLSALLQAQVSFVVSLIAITVVAVAFSPLRDRLQRGINRLTYGERDEPYRVISRLGQRLEAAFEPADVLPAIVQAVGESLKLPYVAIGLTLDDWRPRTEDLDHLGTTNGLVKVNSTSPVANFWSAIAASYGQPPHPQCPKGALSPISTLPLAYQGETVGQLFVTPRSGEASLSEMDQHLLADLAHQAGVAVHGVRLMTELRRLTADLQCSRERLVLAREEERRRLRRDLHDDLAPTLAGLALTAGTVGDLIPTDPVKALALATDLNKSIRATVGDIRRLVYDLRPPALDELGLVAAIQERAAQYSNDRSPTNNLRVIVEADKPLPPLPAAVEVAAYRIIQEALMNVVRHAQARTCHIRLTYTRAVNQRPLIVKDGLPAAQRGPLAPGGNRDTLIKALQIEVSDDGIGLTEPYSPGVGLHSMKERAAELGGVCTIERRARSGTRVFVSLPIPEEEPGESTSHPYR